MTHKEFNAEFEALKARYLQRLDERISRMEAALYIHDHTALHTEAHQLAGNGSIFGFSDISQQAKIMEDLLRSTADPDLIRNAMERLIQACREAQTRDR